METIRFVGEGKAFPCGRGIVEEEEEKKEEEGEDWCGKGYEISVVDHGIEF